MCKQVHFRAPTGPSNVSTKAEKHTHIYSNVMQIKQASRGIKENHFEIGFLMYSGSVIMTPSLKSPWAIMQSQMKITPWHRWTLVSDYLLTIYAMYIQHIAISLSYFNSSYRSGHLSYQSTWSTCTVESTTIYHNQTAECAATKIYNLLNIYKCHY